MSFATLLNKWLPRPHKSIRTTSNTATWRFHPRCERLEVQCISAALTIVLTSRSIRLLSIWLLSLVLIASDLHAEEPTATYRLVEGAKLLTRTSFPKHVGTVLYSPDGNALVLTCADETIQMGNREGNNYRVLVKQQHGFSGMCFAPDGRHLGTTTVASGGEIRIIEFPSAKVVRVFGSWSRRSSRCIAWSPDGSMLALGGEDGVITLCEAATAKRVHSIPGDHLFDGDSSVHSLTFSPNSKLLASGGNDRSARIWDVATGIELFAYIDRKEHAVRSVGFSPNSRMFAQVGNDESVRVWEVCTGKERWRFPVKSTSSSALAFSPDGRTLAVGGAFSADGGADTILWDLHTGKKIQTIPTESTRVWSLAYSPFGDLLACAENGKDTHQVAVWRISNRYQEPTEVQPGQPIDHILRDMENADAVRAFRAILYLPKSPRGITALKLKLQEVKEGLKQRSTDIAALVKALESNNFRIREQATNDLQQFGTEAAWALKSRLKREPSLELRKRIGLLLPLLLAKGPSGHVRFVIRAIEALELQRGQAAEQSLRDLCQELPAELAAEASQALRHLAKSMHP